MVSPVSCGRIDKNIIFPIIPALTLFFYKYALRNEIIETNPIIFLLSSVSKCLSFIPFLITKKRSKTKYVKDISDKLVQQYKKIRCQRFYLILISTFLEYIQTILSQFFVKFDSNHWAFDILVINLVSFLLLKTKLYKHHYFCLIIIFICGIISNIIDYRIYFSQNRSIINIILNYIKDFLLCLENCIDKYTMDKKYTSPYELCLYNGLFSFCLYSVTFGILVLYDKKYIDDVADYLGTINRTQILYIFLFFIFYFVFFLFIYISIKIYNPNYIINIFITQEIYHSFILHNELKIYLNIVIAVIFVFLFLVFNEIIEINCCGLQKNTKRNIKKRVKKEAEKEYEINDDDDDDDNKDNVNENDESMIGIRGFSIELDSFKDKDSLGIGSIGRDSKNQLKKN